MGKDQAWEGGVTRREKRQWKETSWKRGKVLARKGKLKGKVKIICDGKYKKGNNSRGKCERELGACEANSEQIRKQA